MNLDDPRLTAFALDELDEKEKSAIAREIADSPEAQRFVQETQELARALKKEYREEHAEAPFVPLNLSDIRDDPWFWSVARPLAIAAAITVVAIIGAVTMAKYKSRSNPPETTIVDFANVEAGNEPQTGASSGPENVPNPLHAETIRGIERAVIGELNPNSKDGEIRVIESITDVYRLQHLKDRLTTPLLSKKADRGSVGRAYELMFLDGSGRVLVSAGFYQVPGLGFVLQPSRFGYERGGHYFTGGNVLLPGDWQSDIDYARYFIPFSDWNECVGYSPGA